MVEISQAGQADMRGANSAERRSTGQNCSVFPQAIADDKRTYASRSGRGDRLVDFEDH
jgi:hypothetical protein